jgi:ribonuclease BN (tRNA processing enzyme)
MASPMRAWLLGSGGWFPTDERETTSVFVRLGHHGLLIDAGTGTRRLLTEPEFVDGLGSLDIVLTHFHLDHICGLLYLPGLFTVGALKDSPRVWAPGQWLYGHPSAEILDRVLRPPVSPLPVPLTELVEELIPDQQQVGPFKVSALAQPRHWAPSVGLRVLDHLAVITDTARELDHVQLADGVPHLLHQAWSTSTEPIFADHDATARDAARTAAEAGVGHLTLIHLNPLGDLDALLADARQLFPAAQLGRDGTEIWLGAGD